ncbi:MAG: tetratricopeptide repeat protein, partial [Pseudomonadota bacterium]
MKKTLNQALTISAGIIFSFFISGCERESSEEKVSNHLFLAESYFKQGQLSASAIESNNALQINGNTAQAHFILAKALLITGDAVNAENRLKKAIASDPNNTEYQFTLIDALIQLKRLDEAESYFKKLPADKINSARSYYLNGKILFNRQD